MTTILDNNAELKIRSYEETKIFSKVVVDYKANLKSGKITYSLVAPYPPLISDRIENLKSLYRLSYGHPDFILTTHPNF